MIKPGDFVKPKPEYESLGQVPSGKVLSVVPFGQFGAVYVEGEKRAFVAECLEAGFKLQVTGKVQAVELDEPEAEH